MVQQLHFVIGCRWRHRVRKSNGERHLINRSTLTENPNFPIRTLRARAGLIITTRSFCSLMSAKITDFPNVLAKMRIAGCFEALLP